MNDLDNVMQQGLYFIPLGGAGEIGMNVNLLCCDGYWIMIDLGVTFPRDGEQGVDVILPDTAFIEKRKDQLGAIVITHGHEDHIGALPYLWDRFQVPVYCTTFTSKLIKNKLLRSNGKSANMPLIEVDIAKPIHIGPFEVTYMSTTHSIPESHALLVTTRYGNVFHSGDWKLDPGPVVEAGYDAKSFQSLRRRRIKAMLCDSTNALTPGWSGSEQDLYLPILELVKDAKAKVFVTCFASNVARLITLARIAKVSRRYVCVLGMSLVRNVRLARQMGWWDDLPAPISPADAGFLAAEEVLYICTGSQGESRAMLNRLTAGECYGIMLQSEDLVVFSSKDIPGNEDAINKLKANLAAKGASIVDANNALVHVTGHPCQDELYTMYDWVRPSWVIPVHGEDKHMRANANIASKFSKTVLVKNGDVVDLSFEQPALIANVEHGRLGVFKQGIKRIS